MPEIQSVNELIAKARRTSAERDAIDKRLGFATPEEAGQVIETAIEALTAAMRTEDWNLVAECYVLLEKVKAHA